MNEPMGWCEVKNHLGSALEMLHKAHSHLYEVDVNERSLTHWLAVYLSRLFPGFEVDVEYNRNLEEPKRLQLTVDTTTANDIKATTVFPDVIVHRRGSHQNLLVVEVKKGPRADGTRDAEKLKAFTRPEPDGLGYRFGAFVRVNTDGSYTLNRYERGEATFQSNDGQGSAASSADG